MLARVGGRRVGVWSSEFQVGVATKDLYLDFRYCQREFSDCDRLMRFGNLGGV